jgi:hypothetical protein
MARSREEKREEANAKKSKNSTAGAAVIVVLVVTRATPGAIASARSPFSREHMSLNGADT